MPTKWDRVEVADPIFRTRKQGRRIGENDYVYVDHEMVVLMRVVSPTVAYVNRLESYTPWVPEMEPTEMTGAYQD